MPQFDVDEKIRLIRSLAGHTFETKTDLPFTYEVHRDTVYPSRTDYALPLSEFRKALDLVPLKGPGEITWKVRGPSYVWAILHDPRVRGDDWWPLPAEELGEQLAHRLEAGDDSRWYRDRYDEGRRRGADVR